MISLQIKSCGAVICSSEGVFIQAFARRLIGHCSSQEAEIWAIWYGMPMLVIKVF